MYNAQPHFAVTLNNLGNREARFADIMVPNAPGADSAVGVTDQFLENAERYHNAYTSHPYWAGLLKTALSRLPCTDSIANILDIGSGSGNSVIPLMERFPQARIVASDISPQLLSFLRDAVTDPASRDRLALVCMDAGKDFYVPETFDLVVGAAILHHIYHPDEMIRAVLRCLKPGGHAIFFEPFEDGNAILRLAYEQILSDPRAAEMEAPGRQLLARMCNDYAARMDPSHDEPIFTELDDKWMFTRSFFFDLAQKLNVANTIIYPLHGIDTPFAQQTKTYLRLGSDLGPEALPQWVWDHIAKFDRMLSPRVKEDLPIEACVILRK